MILSLIILGYLLGIVRELQNYLTSAPNNLVISLQLTSVIVKGVSTVSTSPNGLIKELKDTYNNPFNNPKRL